MSRVVPFIFSWKGQFDNAVRIEGQLQQLFSRVIVINSDEEHTRPGWFDVGDECYFTAQFFKALELFDGDVLFHVQADASYHDWRAVFANAERYLGMYNWGLYAPNVDFSGWSAPRVDVESSIFAEPFLRLVSNTDCTCWLIHRDILVDFRDYAHLFRDNRYGWGVDLTMSALSYVRGRPVVRDYSHTVVHPRGHGYDGDGAAVEYQRYLAALDQRIGPVITLILNDRQRLARLIEPMPASPPRPATDLPG